MNLYYRIWADGIIKLRSTNIYKLSTNNKDLISKVNKGGIFDTMQIVQLTDKELWLKKSDVSFVLIMSKK